MIKDTNGLELKVGDKVRVYKDTDCRDFKCITTIRDIGSIPSASKVVWLEGVSGCWHPKALIKIKENLNEI